MVALSSVRILGPVEVWAGEQPFALSGRQLTLLAVLVVNAGNAVSVDRLIDALWPTDGAASGARKRLQMTVTRLRQALEPVAEEGMCELRTSAAATGWSWQTKSSTRASSHETWHQVFRRHVRRIGCEPATSSPRVLPCGVDRRSRTSRSRISRKRRSAGSNRRPPACKADPVCPLVSRGVSKSPANLLVLLDTGGHDRTARDNLMHPWCTLSVACVWAAGSRAAVEGSCARLRQLVEVAAPSRATLASAIAVCASSRGMSSNSSITCP